MAADTLRSLPWRAKGQDVLKQQPEKLSARQDADLVFSLMTLISQRQLAPPTFL
jgi:hypothetical protein